MSQHESKAGEGEMSFLDTMAAAESLIQSSSGRLTSSLAGTVKQQEFSL